MPQYPSTLTQSVFEAYCWRVWVTGINLYSSYFSIRCSPQDGLFPKSLLTWISFISQHIETKYQTIHLNDFTHAASQDNCRYQYIIQLGSTKGYWTGTPKPQQVPCLFCALTIYVPATYQLPYPPRYLWEFIYFDGSESHRFNSPLNPHSILSLSKTHCVSCVMG